VARHWLGVRSGGGDGEKRGRKSYLDCLGLPLFFVSKRNRQTSTGGGTGYSAKGKTKVAGWTLSLPLGRFGK
jgi:hypothetical protein